MARLTGSQRAGLALAGALIGLLLLWVGVRVYVREARIDEATLRVQNRLRLPRSAFELEEVSADGTMRMRLNRVALLDAAGDTILGAPVARLVFRADALGGTGPVRFDRMEVDRPSLRLVETPDGEWNLTKAFRVEADGAEVRFDARPDTLLDAPRPYLFRDVRITDGEAMLATAVQPGDPLPAQFAARGGPPLVRMGGRTMQVRRARDVDARLTQLRVGGTQGWRAEVGDLTAEVSNPDLRVAGLRGWIEEVGPDRYRFDFGALRTPFSTFSAAGAFRLAEDRILWDARVRAAPLDFRDLRGLGFGVPEGGRAAFTLDVESLPDGRLALRSPDAAVTTPESRISGRFAAVGGGGRPWVFTDTRLSLDPLDLATVGRLGFAEVPYEGTVRGTVASLDALEQGRPGALRVDLAASFRPRGAGGEPSVVAAAGDVTVGGDAPFRLDGVRLEARPVHLAALAPFVTDPAQAARLRGVLRGSAVASGTPADLRVAGGTIAYEVGDAPPTRIADLTARVSTDPALRYQVGGRAAPLALATLTELFPQLPFRGATLSGPFSVTGTAERTAFDADLRGAAGRLAVRGTVLPGPLRFDVSGEVEAFRSGVVLAAGNPVQGPLTGTFAARGSTQDFGFDVDLAHGGGAFVLGGRVRDPGDGMQFDVAGRVRDFRLGTVLGRPGLFNSPLTGPVALTGGGRQPYRFDVDLRGPVGLLDLEGWFHPGEVPSYSVAGQVAGVNPQRLPGGEGLPAGNLTASLRVEGRGTTPETFEGRVDLDARSSTLAGVPMDAAVVRLAAAGGVLRIDTLAAAFQGARVAASGSWGLTRPVAEPLRLSLAADDLAALAPLLLRAGMTQPDLAGSLALEGWVSGSFRSPSLGFAGTGAGLRYGTWRAGQLALQARATLGPQGWTGNGSVQADGVLLAGREEFQNLRLELNAIPGFATFGLLARRDGESDLTASGSLALEGRELRGVELQALALRLGTAQWQLLQPARIRWGGVQGIEVERLALRRSGDGGGTIEMNGRLPPTGNTDLTLRLAGVDLADLRRITAAAPEASGRLDLTTVLSGPVGAPEMTITGSVDSLRYGGAVAERVALDARYAGRQMVGSAVVRLAGQDVLTVEGTVPMLVSLGGTVPGFELLRGDALRARLMADSVPLALVSASVPALEGGEGALSADVVVLGTLEDPTVNGWAAMEDGAFTVVPLGQRFTEIRARLAMRGEEVRIDTLTARSDGTASISGSVLLDEPTRPRVLLTVRADEFDVMDRADLAQLKVSSDLTLSGRLPEATLSGRLVLEEGTIQIPTMDQRREVAIVDAEVGEIGADTIPEEIAGTDPAAVFGGLRVTGLQVVVDDGVWLESEDARIQIRGSALVTRTGAEPRIYGDLEVVRGTYALRVGPLRREFDIERGLVQFYGTPDLNPTLDILATNQVRTMDPGASGSVLQVQVQVSGTLQAPSIQLSSNTRPPLPESELLSYLVFGRSTANLGGSTGAIAQQILAQELFGGLVAAELEQELSRSGLVDYVRVRSGGGPDGTGQFALGNALGVVGLSAPTFEFGWELSNDLFLTAELGFQALDQSPLFGIGLDYQINERTRARLARESVRRDVFNRPFYKGPEYQWTFDLRHRWEWGTTRPDTTALDSLADSAAAAATPPAAPAPAPPQPARPAVPDPPAETPKKEERPR